MRSELTATTKQNSPSNVAPKETAVTKEEILATLRMWGENLVAISKSHRSGGDYKKLAQKVIEDSYAYDRGPVLFKPTLASKHTFRITFEGAHSYFVGGNTQFEEDRGFALNNWDAVDFEVAGVILAANHGIVMGNKLLKNSSGQITIANFTMGFIRDPSGKLKINLHHSSLPYQPN